MADEWEEFESTGKSFATDSYQGKFGESKRQESNGWQEESNGWQEENGSGQDRSSNGYESNGGYGRGGGGGGGGRGRGGGGRGRGRGVSGYRDNNDRNANRSGDDYDNNENSDNDYQRNERGGGGGRGRGRGRGRGGSYSNGNDRNDSGDRNRGDGEDKFNSEKPREFYIPEDPTLDEDQLFKQGISSGINFDKFDKIPVNVSAGAPAAITSFDTAGLNSYLVTNIKRSGYTKPTPIQKHSIPIVMAKRDLMACAQTGSGKTAAFLLPILHDLLNDPQNIQMTRPHVLIVSPTRELSIQIYQEAKKFAAGSFLQIALIYGGTAVKHQSSNIARGIHMLVCTPGRLLDFVEKGFVSFEDIQYVVLDEADRMLDLGFMPAVEQVMNHPTMPEKRNTLMYSATFPEPIQRLAGKFLDNYVFLAVGIVGSACTDVEQNFHQVSRFEKKNKLIEILGQGDPQGTLVFVETKRNTDFLASYLSETQYPTTSIHGDRLQREREEALRDFKSGKMMVLIATSVAARGLDIKNVAHVVNYDLPKTIDEYVHRIGRTGRVGNCGKATSFFDPSSDSELATDLVKILQQANQVIPDFLSSVSVDSAPQRGNSRFGSRDVRRNQWTRTEVHEEFNQLSVNSVPEADEPEEEW